MPNLIEDSKASWDSSRSIEHINAGSLQRIAAATELMARNYQTLVNERDNYQRWYREEKERRQLLERRAKALRGVITRQKSKLTAASDHQTGSIIKQEGA